MVGPTGRESDKFMLRLPEGMRDRIRAEGDKNGRSMNAEIVQVLERAYPAPLLRNVTDPGATHLLALAAKIRNHPGLDALQRERADLYEQMAHDLLSRLAERPDGSK